MLPRKYYTIIGVVLGLFIVGYFLLDVHFLNDDQPAAAPEVLANNIAGAAVTSSETVIAATPTNDQNGTPRPSWAPTTMSMKWELSKFAWSFGMAQQCDVGADSPLRLYRGFMHFDKNMYANISAGDIVWVWTPESRDFADFALPSINQPCVLLVSGEDNKFPFEWLSLKNFQDMIANPYVVHIFAQNFDNRNMSAEVLKKVSHVPIGLHYSIPGYRDASPISPTIAQQDGMLQGILDSLSDRSERKLRIHSDFHHSNWFRNGYFKRYLEFNGEDRVGIFRTLNATGLLDYSMRPQGHLDTMIAKTHYVFSASPPGNGIDCHRTWESLLMGNIVIVMETGLEPLYEGLPVVVVKNYTEVTADKLVIWEKQFRDLKYESYKHRLTNKFWFDKMIKMAAPLKKKKKNNKSKSLKSVN
jgi:hypothetical protein